MSFGRVFRKGILVLLLSVLTTGFIAQGGRCEETAKPASLPPFALKGLDGTELKMEALKEYPLSIVIFFATWNPKSVPALVELQKFSDKYEKNNLAVLAINAENEKTDASFKPVLEKFLADNKITLSVVVDEGLATYRAWEIKALPTTYVFDKDLKVLAELAGAPTSYRDTVEELVVTNLGLKPKEEEKAAEQKRYRPEKALTLQYGLVEKKAERGRTSQALTELEEIIKKDEKFADAFALKGVLLLSEKKPSEEEKKTSKEAFDKAASLDPTLPLALIGQAWFFAEGNDLKKAVELLTVALSQTNWGTRDKPENLKDLLATVEAANAKIGKDDAGARKDLTELMDGFLTIHAGPKVNMKKMEEKKAAEKEGAPAK